jgi:hypothetical protein
MASIIGERCPVRRIERFAGWQASGRSSEAYTPPMRRLVALLAAAILAAACGSNTAGPPAADASPEPDNDSVSPSELPGASCRDRGGGSAETIPDFVSVDVESVGDVDRVTFGFRPRDPSAKAPPSYSVRLTDELLGDEAGTPEVDGEIYLVVVFSAFGVDLSGEEPVEIYTGPTELTPDLSTVVELEELGDFEATVTWAIGLSRRACYRLDAGPDELVLEFPAA